MGRILSIDFGQKRTGIAITDPLKMIASPLETVSTSQLLSFLKNYVTAEPVDTFVVGMPKTLQNKDTHITAGVRTFIMALRQQFPNIPVVEIDERFTSKMAFDSMIAGGMKKKDRRDKANIDKVSAAIILQSYLESPSFRI